MDTNPADAANEAKVLLPGPTVLARLVASVRDQAATRLWQSLAMAPDAAGRPRLAPIAASGRCAPSTRRWVADEACLPAVGWRARLARQSS